MANPGETPSQRLARQPFSVDSGVIQQERVMFLRMRIAVVEKTLARLAELIASAGFEELETDTLEIKNVPADASGWTERHKSICAFLNTRGGIVIFGVKDVALRTEV
jgi:hypothetical protein